MRTNSKPYLNEAQDPPKSDFWVETCGTRVVPENVNMEARKSSLEATKSPQEAPKSRPRPSKIEPGAFQDAILKDI